MSDLIKKLYSSTMPSTRTGLFFNTYSYPTKISPESIAVYIASHTEPGDTVLDAFAGSGSTGIAALMCEHPTKQMKDIAKKLGVSPKWGARNAILYDISSYGSFAAGVMANAPIAKDFEDAARSLIDSAKEQLPNIYSICDDQGNEGVVRHVIWSYLSICPKCGSEISYYDTFVSHNPLSMNKEGACPFCNKRIKYSECEPSLETHFDSLLDENVTQRKRQPARIYGVTNGRKWFREASSSDVEDYRSIESAAYASTFPPKSLQWGELRRSGYHRGISHLHHFYTKRNYNVFAALWAQTDSFDPAMRDALRLLLLSYNSTHSTLMTRVVAKKNSKDFVLTGAQSGVLYISNLPVEKNIFLGLERKISSFVEAFDYLNKCSGSIKVNKKSSVELNEANDTVDYAFIDPPFGDFIPYSEVNQINELWLPTITDKTDEAIISPSQGKTVDEYGHLLETVLSELSRVLKKSSYLTVVFHSSKAAVWNAFKKSLDESGMSLIATSILGKTQGSFKQVVSSSAVQNDALILMGFSDLAQQASSSETTSPVDERTAYTMYVNDCISSGKPVLLDAKEAYELYRKGAIDE